MAVYEMQGGDLYRMQQEAIRRAREMAQRACPPPPPPPPPAPPKKPASIRPILAGGQDTVLILGVLLLLLLDGCQDLLLFGALVFILLA